MQPLSGEVEALMRLVAATIVMPRYQQLETYQIEEKTPGELVTIADRESEERLNEGLSRILPEARLIGEEACAANPALMDGLGEGTAWIIDPIDGTSNFAAGKPHFGLMIALVADGKAIAGWMYDPLRDRMCHAHAGRGAFVDGARISACETGNPLPVGAISFKFMNPADRDRLINATKGRIMAADPPMCAAEQYPRVVLGENDFAVFERTLPWDHVPGALFVTEAGGRVARIDGSAYDFRQNQGMMIAAASPALWDAAATILRA